MNREIERLLRRGEEIKDGPPPGVQRVTVKEHWPWYGTIKVTVFGRLGEIKEVLEFPNLITTAGKNFMRDVLIGAQTSGLITWVALGSNNTAPAAGDIKLGTEQFRKQVTFRSPVSAGVGLTRCYIAPFECNSFTTEEIGWFAGPAAAAGTDTGILIARVLYHRAKVNTESLQIDRQDQFT